MKRFTLIAGMVFALVISQAHAQQSSIPPLINYQGTLTDANGNLLTGTKKLEVNLYDAVEGGSKVWGPQIFSNVPLIKGMFNVILGPNDTATRSITDAFGAGNRFLGIKIDDGQEIVPRQQILSAPFAVNSLQSFNGVPRGTVIMWYGDIHNIPNGWTLCNGSNGTPDLRDKFVIGAGNTYDVGDTGGSPSLAQHSHTISRGPYPSADLTGASSGNSGYIGITSPNYEWHGTVGVGLTGNINTESSASGSNLPPYYALALIMKL